MPEKNLDVMDRSKKANQEIRIIDLDKKQPSKSISIRSNYNNEELSEELKKCMRGLVCKK